MLSTTQDGKTMHWPLLKLLLPLEGSIHLTVLKDSGDWDKCIEPERCFQPNHWSCLQFKGGISSTSLGARLYRALPNWFPSNYRRSTFFCQFGRQNIVERHCYTAEYGNALRSGCCRTRTAGSFPIETRMTLELYLSPVHTHWHFRHFLWKWTNAVVKWCR